MLSRRVKSTSNVLKGIWLVVRLMGPSTYDTNNLHKFLPLLERFLRGGPFLRWLLYCQNAGGERIKQLLCNITF